MEKNKIVVNEVIQLDDSTKLAYDTIKMSYTHYAKKEGLDYSFDEYLVRCGLTSLFNAFEKEISQSALFEGHA